MTFVIAIFRGFLNLIYALFKLLPVRDKITLISRQSDFPSEDFLMLKAEIEKQSPKTEVKILSKKLRKSPGALISYIGHIFVQMYHIATSKTVVLDSYCIAVSVLKQRRSLRVVQIWHAMGALKRVGLSILGEEEGSNPKLAKAMRMHRNYTHVLASGKACVKPFAEAFGCDEKSIVIGSLPRVDRLMSEEIKQRTIDKIFDIYQELKQAKDCDKKIIVYAPTFRKHKDISTEIEDLINTISSEERIIVIKKHPLMKLCIEDRPGVIIDDTFSTEEMFYIADYVIADYSAIVFEAALLNKPMCFYAFDLDEYMASRSFYLDYEKDMPGAICKDVDEVETVLKDFCFDLEAVKNFAHNYVEKTEGVTKELANLVLMDN
jgi:polyribitolphosphotransferase